MVRWLGLHVSTARGLGLIPGWETKYPGRHLVWHPPPPHPLPPPKEQFFDVYLLPQDTRLDMAGRKR